MKSCTSTNHVKEIECHPRCPLSAPSPLLLILMALVAWLSLVSYHLFPIESLTIGLFIVPGRMELTQK